MIIITSYSERYRQKWDEFVMQTDGSSLFHMIGWKEAVEKSFGHRPHYMMAMRDDTLCGILPLFEIRSRLFGHALVSVPYGVYGGVAALDQEASDTLSKSAETLAGLMRVDYLELRNYSNRSSRSISSLVRNEENADNDFNDSDERSGRTSEAVERAKRSNWFTKDLYVTFQREIFETVEKNLEAIPRKQRAMVRKGEKQGLTSRTGGLDDLEQFYAIYARNVRDLGSPVYPISFFRALMENFRDSFILSVWKDGKMVAGVLTFVHKNSLLPYYGGGLREYFDCAINDFMYWELMKYGCEAGYKVFDFGRSKKETGSYRFKKHWGFEPAELDYSCYLVKAKEMPNVSPVNPKYRLMINVWKRLPLPLTNWLGPKLVRGIP